MGPAHVELLPHLPQGKRSQGEMVNLGEIGAAGTATL